ncbi:MAG: hypothetical protein DELT_00195 [Desulfovibrio sp.]
MRAEENLACSILQSMGIAVLQRTAPREYSFLGNAPQFYADMFSDTAGAPSSTPWENSPMLEFFLDDVERFFEQKKEGSLSSGVWQEDGKTAANTALMAVATTYGNAQVLIIRMLQEDYQERLSILRKARAQLLENRTLSHNLEYFREKSRFDGLTKIFNKTTFTELLHDEIKRSRALDYPLSLLILDIDDFKKVNDTYGHLAGDMVLQALGALLTNTLRRHDIVARFGGEEFVVLLPQENENQALTIAEKVRQSIAAMKFPDVPSITVSIGCTVYLARETADNFIERADTALYDAKTTGKNKVCFR